MNSCRSAAWLTLGLVGVFVGTGCVTVNTTRMDPSENYAPVPENQVRIFQTEEDVPGEFKKVAIFHAEGSTSSTDQSDMLNTIREKAAEEGCNGVIVGEITEPGTGEKVVGALFGTGTDREGKAVGIRWGDLYEGSEEKDEKSGEEEEGGGGLLPF